MRQPLFTKGNPSHQNNRTKRMRLPVMPIVSLLASVFGMCCCTTAMAQLLDMISDYHELPAYYASSHNFFAYVHFGGLVYDSEELPEPPSGDGVLTGKFTYQDKPAKGVTLSLVLNLKYTTANLVTDEEGIFRVNLPAGEWLINSIQTEGWAGKPKEGSFSLYYGGEEKLAGGTFNQYAFFDRPGYPVNVTTDPDQLHLAISIREDIKIIWPEMTGRRLAASINEAIRWEEYPGAANYYVEIEKVERKGTSTHYTPIAALVVEDDNSLALSSLNHVYAGDNQSVEYAVEIYAFAEDGALLAESPQLFGSGTFSLSDGNVLVEQHLRDIYDLASIGGPDDFAETLEAIMLNERRAEAVLVLIEENMLPEAEALLAKIDDGFAPGKREALSGYMLAVQGECAGAKEMFDRAMTIDPGICIPDAYRNMCD